MKKLMIILICLMFINCTTVAPKKNERITANDLRNVTNNVCSNTLKQEVGSILDKCRESAEKGHSRYEAHFELNDAVIKELRNLGFTVECYNRYAKFYRISW